MYVRDNLSMVKICLFLLVTRTVFPPINMQGFFFAWFKWLVACLLVIAAYGWKGKTCKEQLIAGFSGGVSQNFY